MNKISNGDEKDQVLNLIEGLQVRKLRQEKWKAAQEERVAALEKENKELREVVFSSSGSASFGSASHPSRPPDEPSAASTGESEEQVESLDWALRALFLLLAIPAPVFYLLWVLTKDSSYKIIVHAAMVAA